MFLGTGGIPCPACLLDAITPGQKLLLDDGKLLLRVNAVDTALHCTVLRGGLLQSRKEHRGAGRGGSLPYPDR